MEMSFSFSPFAWIHAVPPEIFYSPLFTFFFFSSCGCRNVFFFFFHFLIVCVSPSDDLIKSRLGHLKLNFLQCKLLMPQCSCHTSNKTNEKRREREREINFLTFWPLLGFFWLFFLLLYFSVRSAMHKHLERENEVTFDKIFNQKIGKNSLKFILNVQQIIIERSSRFSTLQRLLRELSRRAGAAIEILRRDSKLWEDRVSRWA